MQRKGSNIQALSCFLYAANGTFLPLAHCSRCQPAAFLNAAVGSREQSLQLLDTLSLPNHSRMRTLQAACSRHWTTQVARLACCGHCCRPACLHRCGRPCRHPLLLLLRGRQQQLAQGHSGRRQTRMLADSRHRCSSKGPAEQRPCWHIAEATATAPQAATLQWLLPPTLQRSSAAASSACGCQMTAGLQPAPPPQGRLLQMPSGTSSAAETRLKRPRQRLLGRHWQPGSLRAVSPRAAAGAALQLHHKP